VARKPEHEQQHVIEEIEGIAERGAQWIRDHLPLTIAALLIVLGTAAAIGALSAHRTHQAEAASDALDRVTLEFIQAVRADPNSSTAPEPISDAIRSEFAAEFGAVAEEHEGTVAAALARLEQGNLSEAAGETDAAIEIWRGASDELDRIPNFQAFFEQRIGHAYESDGRWLEAAESHLSAGAVESYPLRHWALAEAARCLQQAGEAQRAREIALKLAADAPELMLPQHLDAILAELRQMPTP